MRAVAPLCLVVAVPAVVAVLLTSSAAAPTAAADPPLDGQAIFLAQKCNLCHTVSSQQIERTTRSEKTAGPDLTGLAERRDPDWTKKFVTRQLDEDGKRHMKEFEGTPQELDALVGWLMAH